MPAHISEFFYKGNEPEDFVEVAVETGTDISGYSIVVYKPDGSIDETYAFGPPTSTVAGKDVYVVDGSDAGFTGIPKDGAIALVDDNGDVIQFISYGGNTVTATAGPASGLTSSDVGTNDDGESLESTDGGATYSTQASPNAGTVPCYTPGTMIDTPDGPRAVETLRAGDLVSTMDHGPQPIRWVRSGDQPLEGAEVEDRPVLIKAGALGPNRPAQDLIVSPQHRIIVGDGGQLTEYFDTVAFAPAKALTNLPGIRHMKGKREITYVHFACDRHEVVTANGCLSESLLLGPEVLRGLTPVELRTVTRIFSPSPELVMQ